jgi:hypothetical protein
VSFQWPFAWQANGGPFALTLPGRGNRAANDRSRPICRPFSSAC